MNQPKRMVAWVMPAKVAELFHETLSLDAHSHAFDPKLRKQLHAALETVVKVGPEGFERVREKKRR